MQKILLLICQYIICQNIVQIILKQHEVFRIIGDKVNISANEILANCRIKNNRTTTSKSFEYRTKVIGKTLADHDILDTKVIVALKYLSNFKRFLNLPLINCEVELNLSWIKNFIISEMLNNTEVATEPNGNPPAAHLPERFRNISIF